MTLQYQTKTLSSIKLHLTRSSSRKTRPEAVGLFPQDDYLVDRIFSGQLSRTAAATWEQYDRRWEGIWSRGLPPGQGFDKGRASGVLLDLLQSGKLSVQGKRVLVPGCGRGYDVVEFAKQGANCVGIDIAPTAVIKAKDLARNSDMLPEQLERASFVKENFFAYSPPEGTRFDVGYDYTFLSSLHPSMFDSWAQHWSELLTPGGCLLTLMFPVEQDKTGGPPFAITPAMYKGLLEPHGFRCIHQEQVPQELSLPGREGREYFAVWRLVKDTRLALNLAPQK